MTALSPLLQIKEWSAKTYSASFACFFDFDELTGVLVGERTQECAVDDGEHCGSGAEAEGEGCNQGEGEGGRSFQLAQGVLQVLPEAFEPDQAPGFAGNVFDQGDVAEFTSCCGAGLLLGFTAGLAGFDVHLKMSADLIFELRFSFGEGIGEEAHASSPSAVRCMTAPMTST